METVSHIDLLTELRLLQNELDNIKKAIDKVTNSQAEEIKNLREDMKIIKNENVILKIRMGQIFAVSGLLSLIIPYIINTYTHVKSENNTHSTMQIMQ